MKNLAVERYFLLAAALYAFVGICLGIFMGIKHDFTYMHLHAHINLLGWVGLAIFGIVYKLYPSAGRGNLGLAHFIVANLGIIIFLAGIYIVISTANQVIIFAVIGSFLTAISMLMFFVNLLINAK